MFLTRFKTALSPGVQKDVVINMKTRLQACSSKQKKRDRLNSGIEKPAEGDLESFAVDSKSLISC
jgi:hypothetical protein